MRDPELVARAQCATARLESAWERWRALQGLGGKPAQPVTGYVGYALKELWGQPRAVIGFSADAAKRLAGFPELARRHVPGQSARQVYALAPAIKHDILAVTSQLSGSQLCHSFLPGSSARLRNTRAGKQPLS